MAHEKNKKFHPRTDFTWILMLQKDPFMTKLPSCSLKALRTGTWAQSMAPVTQKNPLNELDSNISQRQLSTHHWLPVKTYLTFFRTLLSLSARANVLETPETHSVRTANSVADNFQHPLLNESGCQVAKNCNYAHHLCSCEGTASLCGITHTYSSRRLCVTYYFSWEWVALVVDTMRKCQ